MLTVGSLFAGIGGFDLGFERAGMRTLWQVERSEFCRRVLERHFPDAERYEDVRHVGAGELARVDVVCAGVPCQPTSMAGKGLGERDERWLWPDTLRIVGDLEPRWVVLENPAAFIDRGLLGVLGELAAFGYDAEWSVVSAADVGAPHLRERVWILAYPERGGCAGPSLGLGREDPERPPQVGSEGADHASERGAPGGAAGAVQDADGGALQSWRVGGRAAQAGGSEWWAVEPPVGRVAHGVPNRLDQLAALGNALVPQIAEWIGQRIVEYEEGRLAA